MTETELLALLRNPHTKTRGFTMLFDQYKERLYHHIRTVIPSHEATDDVLQNTFIKIYRHVDRFEGKSKLYTWLYRIATNEALSYLKKEASHQQCTIDSVRENKFQQLQASSYFDASAAEKKLQDALDRLPHRQALVFSLHYEQNLKLKEIAVILETSLGNVKALHHLAQKKIKEILKQL